MTATEINNRSQRHVVRLAALATTATLLAGPASAAVFTWDGGGANPNLGTPANWNPDVAPPASSSGNTFVFAGTANLNPNAEGPYTVGKIQFNNTGFNVGGAALNIVSNGTNTGVSTVATTGIFTNLASGLSATISAPITTSNLTMNADVPTAGATLNLDGPITSGGVTGKLGAGRLVLRAANSFAGGIFEVRNGIVGIGAAGAGGLAGQTFGPTTGNNTVIYADGGTRTVASNFQFGDTGGGAGSAGTPRLTQFGLVPAGDGAAFTGLIQGDLIFAGGFAAVPAAAFHRFDVRAGTAATFAGNFSGGNNLTLSKAGAGTLRLNGNNAALPTFDTIAGITVAGTDTALGARIFSGSVNGGQGSIAAPTGATRNFAAELVLSAPVVSGAVVAKPIGLGATSFLGTLNFDGPISLTGLSTTPTAQSSLKPVSVATDVTASVNSPVTQTLGNVFGIQKAGLGNLVLNANNLYTGRTVIVEGPLTIDGTNTSPFEVGGGSLQGDGSVSGLRLFDENTLAGTAAIAAGVLSPGTDATVGTITSTTAEFGAAAGYTFTIDGGTDLLALAGALTITATPASPFSIVVTGAGTGFDENADQQFVLATSTGITGFDAAAFAVNDGGFLPGASGTFSVDLEGTSLVLNYTAIPEPTTLAAIGLVGAVAGRRRRM